MVYQTDPSIFTKRTLLVPTFLDKLQNVMLEDIPRGNWQNNLRHCVEVVLIFMFLYVCVSVTQKTCVSHMQNVNSPIFLAEESRIQQCFVSVNVFTCQSKGYSRCSKPMICTVNWTWCDHQSLIRPNFWLLGEPVFSQDLNCTGWTFKITNFEPKLQVCAIRLLY